MSLNLIIDTNDPQQNGLLVSFSNTGIQQDDSEFVRNDKMLAYSIQPVVSSGDPTQPWVADALDTDTYQVAIGNADEFPESGTWDLSLSVGTTGISWNVSAATLQTTISAFSTTSGYGNVTVVLLSEATYQVTWITNGAVPSMTSGSNTLDPVSNVGIVIVRAGSVGSTAQQIITLRQSPVAYDEPSTLLPVAAVAASIFQNGDSTHNKIYTVAYTAGSYGGSFAVSVGVPRTTRIGASTVANPTHINTVDANGAPQAHGLNTGDSIVISGHIGSTPAVSGTYTATVLDPYTFTVPVNVTVAGYGGFVATSANVTSSAGIATPGMTANDFSLLLQNNALISSSDVSVTRVSNGFNVQFIGLYQLSNAPTLSVTNIDLVAPKGISGFIDLNTVSLFKAFLLTDADELTYTFAIRRLRASGEDKEFFQKPTILKRNIIDVTTMVAVLLPSYLTETQADFLYQALDDGSFSGNVTAGGSLSAATAGFGLKVKEGSNAKQGIGTLVAGTCTVSTTAVLSASHIFLSHRTLGGTPGILTYTIINATSFTVTSTNVADISTFDWLITDPA